MNTMNENWNSPKKSKVKLSLGESFKMIFASKYLGLIALLVLSYGVSVNLVEGVWKSKIQQLYPTKEEYTMYMGQFQRRSASMGAVLARILTLFPA